MPIKLEKPFQKLTGGGLIKELGEVKGGNSPAKNLEKALLDSSNNPELHSALQAEIDKRKEERNERRERKLGVWQKYLEENSTEEKENPLEGDTVLGMKLEEIKKLSVKEIHNLIVPFNFKSREYTEKRHVNSLELRTEDLLDLENINLVVLSIDRSNYPHDEIIIYAKDLKGNHQYVIFAITKYGGASGMFKHADVCNIIDGTKYRYIDAEKKALDDCYNENMANKLINPEPLKLNFVLILSQEIG